MIRVLVVEDSRTTRALLVDILSSDPAIEVVGEARSGEEAVDLAGRLNPDVITMDIHLPGINGLESTRRIMETAPTRIVIVSSSARDADVSLSLEATRVGALTVVATPESPQAEQHQRDRARLLTMIKAMANVRVVRRWAGGRSAAAPAEPVALPLRAGTVRVIAMAASTGGPAALQQVLSEMAGHLTVPVLLVQHIARGFLGPFANWLSTNSGVPAQIAAAGVRAVPGTAYIAPEDQHLGIHPDGTLLLSSAPVVEGFRPSASFLFESAGLAFGSGLAAVILTGMGNDGLSGLTRARGSGAQVLAQDEASSVVFGMPGEAVRAGLADAVLPPAAIGKQLVRMMGK